VSKKKVRENQKPERIALPATLANMSQLSEKSREMLFRCLKLNFEQGGDGTVAIDHVKNEVFIPDAGTVSGNRVDVLRLKPNLVREFAEAIAELEAAEPDK
jgi:hypothetical protein